MGGRRGRGALCGCMGGAGASAGLRWLCDGVTEGGGRGQAGGREGGREEEEEGVLTSEFVLRVSVFWRAALGPGLAGPSSPSVVAPSSHWSAGSEERQPEGQKSCEPCNSHISCDSHLTGVPVLCLW